MDIFSGQQKGFTLIELLVVIAIIGMLSSVVLASLNGARTKSRDARRAADLRQIQTAIELYANDNNGSYPPRIGGDSTVTISLAVLLPTYISTIPQDPKGPDNMNYGYRYCTNANGYAILAHPEKTGVPWWCGVVSGDNPCNWSQFANSCH